MSAAETLNLNEREMIKLNEVTRLYGIPAETIRKWIRRTGVNGVPALKAFKPGRDILISRKELDSYIKKFQVK